MNIAVDMIIVGVFAILGLFAMYEHEQVKTLKGIVETYKNQIAELKTESEQQNKMYDEARERAKLQMQKIQGETKIILATKIPKGCDAAIVWGRNEAINFT